MDKPFLANLTATIFELIWYRRNKKNHEHFTYELTYERVLKRFKLICTAAWESKVQLDHLIHNFSFYAVKMDPIKLNAKLMDNLEFDRDGYVFGTLELTFDARSGGDVYYSCANVRFQNTTAAAKSKGQKIKVESTLTLTDGKGNQRGDIESDGKATELIVPDLISHEAKVDSEDIYLLIDILKIKNIGFTQ
ncbi:hypothetical protein DICPUDRAFT_83785 [Dictyostelium purpureum]|uniref:Uncharacterized protein n=1 Tax=Dictyostelium purpureum TaxID=5786 RepID=F1A0M0_DICPU|nr:uncharacterized protein DICPUDRAFT_83785 [Dictyostelium purpureum]EGC30260.1 hypothetical protein DICPUDRAFT_83785 [Dictyostelium purpureum]|eukprot:XP_003293212.1 hypothetical protein DICPUDRAFT_83785 [Dictyostelium purpureum]